MIDLPTLGILRRASHLHLAQRADLAKIDEDSGAAASKTWHCVATFRREPIVRLRGLPHAKEIIPHLVDCFCVGAAAYPEGYIECDDLELPRAPT